MRESDLKRSINELSLQREAELQQKQTEVETTEFAKKAFESKLINKLNLIATNLWQSPEMISLKCLCLDFLEEILVSDREDEAFLYTVQSFRISTGKKQHVEIEKRFKVGLDGSSSEEKWELRNLRYSYLGHNTLDQTETLLPEATAFETQFIFSGTRAVSFTSIENRSFKVVVTHTDKSLVLAEPHSKEKLSSFPFTETGIANLTERIALAVLDGEYIRFQKTPESEH